MWIPKATDGTSGLKGLAAPQLAQSSSSNGATVASQAQDSSYMASESAGWHLGLENPRRASAGPVFVQQWRLRGQDSNYYIWLPKATDGTSGLKTLAAPQPAQSSSSNGASVASQAQDSSYMDSENDGWHLGLERPRRASAGPVMLSESDGWHLGLERPRRASAGPAFIQQWRQVASQDSSYADSESRGWHPGLDKRRRASAGPVFVQQWRLRGQPGPGQQLYGFRKRRMAPRA